MNINTRPKYKYPQRSSGRSGYAGVRFRLQKNWDYPYDPPETRKIKALAFLKERGKAIAERDLENMFCYTSADVTWTIK